MTAAYPYAPWLTAMARVFQKAGKPLWLVGGAVRNPLMGLPISDVDLCGPALPREVIGLCEGSPVRAVLRAAHFGTVELHVADDAGNRHMAEYTTFREDSYRCGHQPSAVRFTTDLAVDALRRDFSVNALYCLITGDGVGAVVDPTGGLCHLKEGVLHTVTQDPDQVLKDDGLRILRAARFQAELGLAPTRALLDSAAGHVALLKDIAPERLRDELGKVLLADFRYPELERKAGATESGLNTLWKIGAWPYLLPSVGWRPEGLKAIKALELPGEIDAMAGRLAFLAWQDGGAALEADARRLRFALREVKQASLLADAMEGVAEDRLSLFGSAQLGLHVVEFVRNAFAALEKPVEEARASALWEGLLGAPHSLKELAVNGDDLLPLCKELGQPASRLGGLLTELWRQTVEEKCPNEREALLLAARNWLGGEN